jgi:hypothetical protein
MQVGLRPLIEAQILEVKRTLLAPHPFDFDMRSKGGVAL